jgi:hypothetical protein
MIFTNFNLGPQELLVLTDIGEKGKISVKNNSSLVINDNEGFDKKIKLQTNELDHTLLCFSEPPIREEYDKDLMILYIKAKSIAHFGKVLFKELILSDVKPYSGVLIGLKQPCGFTCINPYGEFEFYTCVENKPISHEREDFFKYKDIDASLQKTSIY